jgi:Transposase
MPIFVGIDVAKETHWVTAVDETSRIVHDSAVANDQAALKALAQHLRSLGDQVVVALDVTGSIVTFLEAVLAGEGQSLVHVPGIAVNREGQGYAEANANPTRAMQAPVPGCARSCATRPRPSRCACWNHTEAIWWWTKPASCRGCASFSVRCIPASNGALTSPKRPRWRF